MGWALDALLRDLGIVSTANPSIRRSSRKQKEANPMIIHRQIPEPVDLVRVCSDRHIIGHTEKAIRVKVGQTLYGEPITTFYPKSLCQIKLTGNDHYDVYVPKWANRRRSCYVGDFECHNTPGFADLPF